LARIRDDLIVAASYVVLATLAPGAALADEPKALVRGVEDDLLRGRIEDAVGRTDRTSESRFQARRRAAEAAEDAVAVLRSEGYYSYEVTPEVTGTEPPKAVLRVTPGPQFRIGTVAVDWLTRPDPKTEAAADKAIDLAPGLPGRAAEVLAAEGRLVARLSSRGYADATAGERRVVVDHADHTVQPTFRIDAGPLVRMDGIQLETKGRTNPRWIAGLTPWAAGQPYNPEDVAELERRLLDTGVYDSVTVSLAPAAKTTTEGTRPVIVSLSDRPKSTIELGLGYSTSEGFGFDGLWNRYNRFGRADTVTAIARVAQIQQRLGLQLALPHWRKPARTLTLATEVFRETTDAYDRAGANVRAELKQRIGKTSFYSYGVAAEFSQNLETQVDPITNMAVGVRRNLGILTGLAGLQWDRSDDPLDPTRGWRVIADVQPTVVTGDGPITFLRAQVQGTAYYPFDKQAKTVVAGRLRVGSIVNGTLPEVPADRRFYAGGGGSVRGYEYQGIGPRQTNGQPLGGLSLVDGSVELRRTLFGKWGAAVFVDGGAVGTEPTFDLADVRFAGGFGVRYALPFGPVRADVAFPFDNSNGQPAFQVYISIGQAF
jgi:translocation and assembly module TamA